MGATEESLRALGRLAGNVVLEDAADRAVVILEHPAGHALSPFAIFGFEFFV